jgi:hypothetical protein
VSFLSGRNDAVVFHADIEALGYVMLTLALGTGLGFDLVYALEWQDRLSRTNRFAVTAGGAYVSNNLKSHGYSPGYN